MANFELFCRVISSGINLLFLKSNAWEMGKKNKVMLILAFEVNSVYILIIALFSDFRPNYCANVQFSDGFGYPKTRNPEENPTFLVPEPEKWYPNPTFTNPNPSIVM